MRKTFCDKCGEQCQGFTGRLMLAVTHETSQREHLGDDEFCPLDLCRPCTDAVRQIYGFRVQPRLAMDMDMEQPMIAQPMIAQPVPG